MDHIYFMTLLNSFEAASMYSSNMICIIDRGERWHCVICLTLMGAGRETGLWEGIKGITMEHMR